MMSLLRRLLSGPSRNLDLVGVWLAAIVAVPLVPLDHLAARDDLVPWTTLVMIAVAFLRGRSLGDPVHPSLTPRRVAWATLFRRAGISLLPLAVALAYETARTADAWWGYAALFTGVLATVGVGVGHLDHRTAWWPRHGTPALVLGAQAAFALGLAAGLGVLAHGIQDQVPTWAFAAPLLGLQFFAVGFVDDRIQIRWQRKAAGRRDGSPYAAPIFPFALALLGPSVGLFLLFWLLEGLVAPVGFPQATVLALHAAAWAAVVWPPRIPLAISCVLHEVVPAAGKDPGMKAQAGFDRPPRGALRLDPLGIKRLRVVHHWLVHVRDPRIEDLDDPVRPLWPRRGFPMPHHVLGEAAFEPEESSQVPQWHTITVRLDEQRDVGRLDQGNAQTRRLAILRPYPTRGARTSRAMRTYRWDPDVPAGTLQVVDATTERLTLQDGDILVLSTEGVARAFELEIGAPIYDYEELQHQRPPQLEDYVAVP